MVGRRGKRRRRSVRLPGFDYSQPGAYYVTIVTHRRRTLFGDVIRGEMSHSRYGEIARACWLSIPDHFPQVELDEFAAMPNRIHGTIVIPAGHGMPCPYRGARLIDSAAYAPPGL